MAQLCMLLGYLQVNALEQHLQADGDEWMIYEQVDHRLSLLKITYGQEKIVKCDGYDPCEILFLW